MKYLVALMLTSFFTTTAYALDRGRWLCNSCDMTATNNVPVGAASDAMAFIRSTVNAAAFPQVNGVTAPKSGWIPGDIVTICDGTTCMTLIYYANGNFVPSLVGVPDSGKGYKNSNFVISSGAVGGSSSTYETRFFWTDYSGGFTTAFNRTSIVIVGPILPPQSVGNGEVIGGSINFSTGFSWGSAISSNGAGGGGYNIGNGSNQGGYCTSSGRCENEN